MKKLLLSIVFALVTFTTSLAVDLNPFAYGLSSELSDDQTMLTITYSLNAPATSVKVVITDGADFIKEYDCSSLGLAKGEDYVLPISTSDFPRSTTLTWRIDVTGNAVNTPTRIDKEYYMYHPRSIDIDNNPENPNFGKVFVIEGLHDITAKSSSSVGSNASGVTFGNYLSWGSGAGLYVFNAAFDNLPASQGSVGYNGGLTYTAAEKISVTSNGNTNNYNVYAPNRVKVSDDGRVFITLCAPVNRGVLLEADKYIFSNAEDRPANWSATGWKKVLVGTRDANTEELEDANGNFIAALNCDIDTKGSGENLQIMLLSGTKNALIADASEYTFSEYLLGENETWNKIPTKSWELSNTVVAYNVAQIEYDNEGGYWLCQDRSNSNEKTYPTLLHVNAQGTIDLKEHLLNRGGAGIRFNNDFTKVIISGKSPNATISGVSTATKYTQGTLAWATVYRVTKENGAPKLTKIYEIDMSRLGNRLPDFAWDHANNIYACSYSKETLTAWAMPHGANEVVSTPAATRYGFTIDCTEGDLYDVAVQTSNINHGTVEGGGVDIASCEEVTAFAHSKEGYKFVCWKDGDNILSTDNPYTFLATKNLNLVAYFEEGDYSVTWWNLFENQEDIAKESTDYPHTNESVWRLLQLFYNNYAKNEDRDDKGTVPISETKSYLHFSCANSLARTKYNFKDYMMDENSYFYWLTKYFKEHKLDVTLPAGQGWLYFPGLFINRSDSTYNSSNGLSNYMANGNYYNNGGEHLWANTITWDSFIKYGKPEYWRPYYTESLGLSKRMNSTTAMPVTWTQNDCPSGTVQGLSESIENTPSMWHVWNDAPDDESYNQSEYLLAWRDGSIGGPIVHHVYRDNMKLYASYVNKAFQENDPEPTNEYDAKNDDVLRLLANDAYNTITHDVTLDRKFVGGMYNTICLPFDVVNIGTDLPDELKGSEVLKFTGVETTYDESGDPVAIINFTPLASDGYMATGIPYLIKPENDVNVSSLIFKNVMGWKFFDQDKRGKGPLTTDTYNGITFYGVWDPVTLPEHSYVLVADNRIAKVTDTSDKILGYRGYFVINDIMLRTLADQGNVYFSFKKPVTTSIPVAPEAEQQTKPQMRKIMREGQIYILRGDEVYTITGTRVK